MNRLNNLLVKTDHFCDYTPLISSITNSVDLFQKYAVLPFLDKATIASNHYYKHINEKSLVRILVLIIPVIGNIIIGIYDFSKKTHDKQTSSRLQDDSLEKISNMTEEDMNKLCKDIKVNNRNDYIKCMLIFAIKAEKFCDGYVDGTFHEMVPYFQKETNKELSLREFVHEDIAAGRNNQEDTLLHEILKCEFLSSKAKGSAFGFILRDGHDYLRDYFGERTLEAPNKWGIQPTRFQVVKWGDSLKKIFDTFPIEQQKEFFANSNGIADRLNNFTGIKLT